MKKMFRAVRGFDGHCHLRKGKILQTVLPFTTQSFGSGIVMPNTDPKILTGQDAMAYREEIINICPNFTPNMTIYLTPQTTPRIIREAKEMGVVAGKLYPEGVTTGSESGIRDITILFPVFEEMEKVGMVLSIHGQLPGKNIYCLDREEKFLPTLIKISKRCPNLKIVLEHISTHIALAVVSELPDNVAATITVHHMVLTTNDVMDAGLQPHNFCIPPAQRPEDRDALIGAAISGNPKLFFGSDTAPHLQFMKECAKGKGGVFSAPVALQLLAQIFDQHGALGRLNDFISEFGPAFYNLQKNDRCETITLERQDWTVPSRYPLYQNSVDCLIPFMAGETIHWRIY